MNNYSKAYSRVCYGRAPAGEINSILSQSQDGGVYDPNNTADAILADKLDDYNDPRADIVRQDIKYRGKSGDGSEYSNNLNKHATTFPKYWFPNNREYKEIELDSDHSIQYFPYYNGGIKVVWNAGPLKFMAIMSREEAESLMKRLQE